jgi:hypothetical protein
MLSLKYSLKCCTSLNLFEFGFENSIEKGMEKELENSEKKKRIKQPSRPKSAEPGRAPAPSDRQIPPVSGSSPLRALSPLLAAQWGRSVGASFSPPPRALSLCLVGPDRQAPSRCPARPFPLYLRCGPALSVPPPPRSPWTGACALAHVTGFLGHDARPHAQLPS